MKPLKTYPPDDLKLCRQCGLEKPHSDFQFRTRENGRSYPRSLCRDCATKKNNSWHAKRAKNNRWTMMVSTMRFRCHRRPGTWVPFTPKQMQEHMGYPVRCALCGGDFAPNAFNEVFDKSNMDAIEVDHIQPVSRGGLTELSNLAWTHRRCNRMKCELTLEEMVDLMQKMLQHLT